MDTIFFLGGVALVIVVCFVWVVWRYRVYQRRIREDAERFHRANQRKSPREVYPVTGSRSRTAARAEDMRRRQKRDDDTDPGIIVLGIDDPELVEVPSKEGHAAYLRERYGKDGLNDAFKTGGAVDQSGFHTGGHIASGGFHTGGGVGDYHEAHRPSHADHSPAANHHDSGPSHSGHSDSGSSSSSDGGGSSGGDGGGGGGGGD